MMGLEKEKRVDDFLALVHKISANAKRCDLLSSKTIGELEQNVKALRKKFLF